MMVIVFRLPFPNTTIYYNIRVFTPRFALISLEGPILRLYECAFNFLTAPQISIAPRNVIDNIVHNFVIVIPRHFFVLSVQNEFV